MFPRLKEDCRTVLQILFTYGRSLSCQNLPRLFNQPSLPWGVLYGITNAVLEAAQLHLLGYNTRWCVPCPDRTQFHISISSLEVFTPSSSSWNHESSWKSCIWSIWQSAGIMHYFHWCWLETLWTGQCWVVPVP